MTLIVDVQCFMVGKNKLIVKEFAAYDGTRICHHLFKPPFEFACLPVEFQKQANWLMAYHHAIDWDNGFTKHNLFPQILKQVARDAKEVYVKGREKADFVRKHITIPVMELPETPPLKKEPGSCFFHMDDNCFCALTNVRILHDTFK